MSANDAEQQQPAAVVSDDDDEEADDAQNAQEEREYNRYDLSKLADDEDVCWPHLALFACAVIILFKEIDITQTVTNAIPDISRFTQLKVCLQTLLYVVYKRFYCFSN